MSAQDNHLEVWLDDEFGPARPVGTLAHGRRLPVGCVLAVQILSPGLASQ
ncbi:hypothetical protein [Bordetella pseudohinzii]|nr:hypothetical protein [Bordetella pseudohinzii]